MDLTVLPPILVYPPEEPSKPEKKEPEQPTKPEKPKKVTEESQIISESETVEKGKETKHIKTLTPKDVETINRLVSVSAPQIANPADLKMLGEETPIEFLTQTYCSYVYYFIVFESENHVVTGFVFRTTVTDPSDFKYLGKSSFAKTEPMTSDEIMEKLVKLQEKYDEEDVQKAVADYDSQYAGQQPDNVFADQVGEQQRFIVVYKEGESVSRFIVTKSNGVYTVEEMCRVEPKDFKPKTTTKTKVSGEQTVKTKDVKKLLEEDEVADQIVKLVKEKKDVEGYELDEAEVSEYADSVEYDLTYVRVDSDNGKPVKKDEIVVHDKTTHQNTIIEQVKPEKAPKDEKEEKEDDTEEKFTVVQEKDLKEKKDKKSEAILNMTEEVRKKENLKPDEFKVDVILVDDKGKVNKVKEVLSNEDKSQNILVTAIVDEETGKAIIEETKPVKPEVAEHFKPKPEKKEPEQPQKPEKPKKPIVIDPTVIDQVVTQVE